MEKYYYKKILIGLKITKFLNGSIPHTSSEGAEENVGVLTLKYPKNTNLRAHIHTDAKRITHHLQEAFIVVKGKVRVSLFGPDKKFFKYIFLKEGQLFLAINGGHAFHMLKDSEMFEVKNGPFKEDKVFI